VANVDAPKDIEDDDEAQAQWIPPRVAFHAIFWQHYRVNEDCTKYSRAELKPSKMTLANLTSSSFCQQVKTPNANNICAEDHREVQWNVSILQLIPKIKKVGDKK